MIGILLIAAGEFFGEIGASIGKYEMAHKKESIYAVGFLDAIWTTLFLMIIAFLRNADFVFSFQSLPTFITRAVLEVVLVFVSIHAVLKADRSTFSFLRTLTIPLLLVVDIALGYNISLLQIIGTSIAVIAVLILFLNPG